MDQNVDDTADEQPMQLEKLLHYRVQRLASKMTLITTREVLAGTGVHIGEWRLICLLREHGKANHTAISRRLGLDPGRTSKLLKAAERKELVQRSGDPSDGRASFFALTPKAENYLQQHWPLASTISDDFLSLYSPSELESLNILLDRAILYADRRLEDGGQN